MSRTESLHRDRSIVLGVYALAVIAGLLVVLGLDTLHPIWTAALADVAATVLVFAFSLRTDNSSMYDPYWSVAPVFIAAYWWAIEPGPAAGLRPAVVFLLVLAWGARLTMNWIRRWGGLDDEDWRYVMLRRRHGDRYWLVSFLGIHLMPTVLVFLGCLPLYAVFSSGGSAGSLLDFTAAGITILAIWIEARADTELRRFRESNPPATDVLDKGLWSKCRHPNYLGEVLFWWGLFLFGLAADLQYWWTGVGALSITLLFVFISVPMIDERMLERRPGYEDRIRSVPALLPRLGKGMMSR